MQIDSRRIEEGDLFVAVGGGDDFARHAFARGAAAALVPDDAFAALAALGSAVRDRSSARVVGDHGLDRQDVDEGHPRRALPPARADGRRRGRAQQRDRPAADADAGSSRTPRSCVCEMGMRGLGQIAELCAIARPDIGVITSIGPVHLELLGTVENVARGEGRGRRRAARRAEPRSSPTSRCSSRTSAATTSRSAASGRRASSRSSASRRQPGRLRRSPASARARVPVHRAPPGAERGRRPARGTGARPAAAAGARRRRALALARRGVAAPRRRPADQRRVQREPGLDAGRARAPRRAPRAARSPCSARWPSSARRRPSTTARSASS